METAPVLLAIARGERPVSDAASIGITFEGDGTRRYLTSSAVVPAVAVTYADLALGFEAHFGQPTLEEWASFVVMAEYEYPEERTGKQERLVEALHDAASGWELQPDALADARAVAGDHG